MDRLSKFVHNKHVDEKGKKAFGMLHTSIILAGPYLATIILFVIHYLLGSEFPNLVYHWVMFAVFVPMIGMSLILTQKWSLVGAYGETILLLIPTFVWLLSGAYEAIWLTVLIAFVFAMCGIGLYIIAFILIKTKTNNETSKRRQKITSMILFRLAFMFSSVVSTMIISVVILNWADFSMDFGHAYLSTVTGERTLHNTETSWILFIAIVTIVTAVSLVLLGLIVSFQSAYHMQHNHKFSQAVKMTLTRMIHIDKLKKDSMSGTIIMKPDVKRYQTQTVELEKPIEKKNRFKSMFKKK